MYHLEILGASLLLKLLVSDLLVTEILGPSLMLKLMVTDLWTLLWNIKFIHPMWKSSSLANFIIVFSVACEISPFTSTHSEPIRAAVLDSTHSMYQLEILGASLLLKLLVTDLALNTLFRDWCSLDFDVVAW